ncbi:unnamed protein product [Adineta ricciae]|uniref:Uncharacterized protein n=1 Tax=Adineta ricciae TaxID=249248 RepID=A0A815RQ89_ADIRI|nr:unnamed protein product [Adineta ricciae]CAF1629464.1 unnamed protein product [Adineta ricciae]
MRIKIFELHVGADVGENIQTTPLLSVHTWTRNEQHTENHMEGIARRENEQVTSLEHYENIQMIPIQDIISIKISSELKRTNKRNTSEYVTTSSNKNDPSRSRPLKSRFIRSFLCCGNGTPKVITSTHINNRTTYSILMRIEYLRPCLAHILNKTLTISRDQPTISYEDQSLANIIEFYFSRSDTDDEVAWKKKLESSEELVRAIFQLKNLNNSYYDVQQVTQLTEKHDFQPYGYVPDKETIDTSGLVLE